MFITFEGIDGSGKTTQAQYLKKSLENLGYKVILTKEPGGTKFGEKIRNILLTEEMDGYSEFLLFAADRNMHVKTLIKPKLEEGYIVISDRFAESSIAYQGYGRGVDLDFIKRVHNEILLNTYPDLIFIIDVPVKVALNRLESKDRIEKSGEDFLKRVRDGYLKIASLNENCIIINGELKRESISENILKILLDRLKWKKDYWLF